MTQYAIILEYLKTHKMFIPAFQANSFITVKGKEEWCGSEIGKRCRELKKAKKVLRIKIQKLDKNFRMRSYSAYLLKK